MTHYQTSHSHILAPGPKGLTETDHLHYLTARLKRSQNICLGQLNGPPPRRWHKHRKRFMSRWLKAARDLSRLGRELFVLEKHNHFIKTKWNMLRDPDWRARVFRELGGEKAMRKWEKRFAKAKVVEPQPEPLGPQYIKPAPDEALFRPTRRASVTTDRAGQFRLTPIKRGPRVRRLTLTLRRGRTYSWDPSWEMRERTFPPIPVTPDELRGDVPIGLDFDKSRQVRSPSPAALRHPLSLGRGTGLSNSGSINPAFSHGETGPRRCAPGPLPPASGEKGVIAHDAVNDEQPQDNTYVEGTD